MGAVSEGTWEGGGAAPLGGYVLPRGSSFNLALRQQKIGRCPPVGDVGIKLIPLGGRVAAHRHAPLEGQQGVGLPTLQWYFYGDAPHPYHGLRFTSYLMFRRYLNWQFCLNIWLRSLANTHKNGLKWPFLCNYRIYVELICIAKF